MSKIKGQPVIPITIETKAEQWPPRLFANPERIRRSLSERQTLAVSAIIPIYLGDIEYLSLTEHERLLREARAEAFAKAADMAVELWNTAKLARGDE